MIIVPKWPFPKASGAGVKMYKARFVRCVQRRDSFRNVSHLVNGFLKTSQLILEDLRTPSGIIGVKPLSGMILQVVNPVTLWESAIPPYIGMF
jgi:hypothetical protein